MSYEGILYAASHLPLATGATRGAVIVGSNITNTAGTISISGANVTAALGFTPEDAAKKNAVNGYAGLDGSTLLTPAQMPFATSGVRGAVIVGSNITVASGTISLTLGNITGALGYTPLNKGGDTMTGALVLSGDPTLPLHAATMQYVQAVAQGLRDFKDSVRVATSGALPTNTYSAGVLTATANAALSVDGVAVAVNDRVLVKNEGTAANNGIYIVTATGSAGAPYVLTRAVDADSAGEVTPGMYVYVEEGTANTTSSWVMSTTGAITIGTTALAFTQFNAAGQIIAGNGLSKTGNTLSVLAADSTISVGVGGIQIGTGIITNTHIAAGAAIVDTKLATIATAGKVADTALSANVALYNGTTAFSTTQSVTVAGTQLKFGAAANQGTLNASSTLASLGFQVDWNGTNWTARGTSSTQVRVQPSQIDFYVDTGLTSGNTFTPTSRFTINATGASGNGSQLTSLTAANLTGSRTTPPGVLPLATTSTEGVVIAGAGLAIAAGTLSVSPQSIVRSNRIVVAAGAITVTTADDIIIVNKTVGAATVVNLPATPANGEWFTIKDGKGDAGNGTNFITITPAAGTIDGQATHVIDANYGCRELVYNGTEWNVM